MRKHAEVLLAAIVLEGLLTIVAYIGAELFAVPIQWGVSMRALGFGVLFCVPLIALNLLLMRWGSTHPNSVYARFGRSVIEPLCAILPPQVAVVVAVLSGFGEELFFRGVLSPLLSNTFGWIAGALLSSGLFAYAHFIGLVRDYGGMIPLYTAVGLYLWGVQEWSHSLCTTMTTHACYNFIAIAIVRTACDQRERPPSTSTRTGAQ
jgi:membrane protease YdiL (CAAX protease family)